MEVFYEGKWGEARHDYPCAPLNIPPQRFHWYGAEWFVPGIYSCAHGVVFDLFTAVPMNEFRTFYEKCTALENGGTDFELEQAEAENPLDKSVQYRIIINGKMCSEYSGRGSTYVPGFEEVSCDEVNDVCALLDAYGLSEKYPDRAWHHMRVQMPWATKRRPKEIHSFVLELTAHDKMVAVPAVFEAAGDGAAPRDIPFSLPDGAAHVLRILKSEKQELPESTHADDKGHRWPLAFSALTYTVEPELPSGVRLQIRDNGQSDKPVYIGEEREDGPAMIGGAIGVIFRMNRDQKELNTASSMYFTVPETIRWSVCLYAKPAEDTKVNMI